MNFEFIHRIITHFLVFRLIFDLYKARVGIASAADIESAIAPLAVLVNRYGLLMPALLCGAVEALASVLLLFTYGVDGTINRTLPLLEARSETIFLAVYAFICSRSTLLCSRVLVYIRSTTIARTAMHFQHPVIPIAHRTLTFFFVENYFASSFTYLKNLPHRLCNYARREGNEKIFNPGKRIIRGPKSEYFFLALAYRATFLVFSMVVFSMSIPIAFLFVYAFDVNSVVIDIDDGHSGEESVDNTLCGTFEDGEVKASSDGGDEVVKEAVVEEQSVCEEGPEGVVVGQVPGIKEKMQWFDYVLKEESHKVSEEKNEDEKKVDAPKQQFGGKTSRLTPFAVPFVPRFARAPQAATAPAFAPVMPVYRAPTVFRPSFPARRASVDWAPTSASLPFLPAPIPTNRSVPPTHWAPAPIVPVVLEAPKRRGGRGGKANKSVDGAELVKKGPSRKERHMKLMGVRAKEGST
ncbi:hypothetical protein D9613_005630 [Agrocybe pediades]|uniref:Uncharacterized protein n=1 Tax=Agrocybe pediades TaxID=84607 RepID=A0A8H4QVG4_9AGAR|nr:hypothetical protein D9613_005630 [Agrocybe pediades]